MTFSGQQPQQRNVEDTDNFKAIVSGGLNTNGNRLLMSGDDSPELYNVEVTSSGALAKRKGFKLEYPFNSHSMVGSIVIPWRGYTGSQFYIVKTEDDLQIRFRDETDTWQGDTIAGAFPTGVISERPDFCVVSDPGFTRVVMVHEKMVPIQLVTTETTVSSTLGAPGNTLRVSLDSRFTVATPGALVYCWVDGVYRDVTNFSYFGTPNEFDIVVSGAAIAAGTYQVDIITFSLQWWAEALKLEGDQIIGQEVQSTATKHVPIPENIRQNINEIYLGLYPIRVYSATTYGAYFTRMANLTPTTNTEYTFSNGVDSSPNRHIPSPNWITFGAVPAAVRTVSFHRYHKIPFTSQPDANLIKVIGRFTASAGFTWAFSGSVPPAEGGVGVGGGIFSFGFVSEAGGTLTTLALGTTNITPDYYIRFDQTSTATGGVSVPQDEYYTIIAQDVAYLQAQGFLGAAFSTGGVACAGFDTYNDHNAAFPAYGIWEASDYGAGSYPSTICTVQNRLVLAGFPNDPMRILISATGDTTIPGEYFNNFQIGYEDGEATDPVDVNLPGRGDDIVLCVREFQASLFAFTRYNVFRISGSEGAITPTSVFSSRISTLGTVNSLSVVSGNNTLYFLNAQGVFSLTPTDDAGGYTTSESSIKIKNLFKNRPYIEISSYVCFDPEQNRLYVGMSDEFCEDIANQLFVYQVDRDAWFIWTDDGGDTLRSSYAATPSLLTGLDSPVFLFSREGVGQLSSMYQDRYADIKLETTLTTPMAFHRSRRVTHTTEADVVEYYTIQSGGADVDDSFRMFPISTYQDCDVYLSGNKLVWGVDYTKSDRSSIFLTNPHSAGLTLVIEHKWRFEDELYHPVCVYEDNRWIEPTDYSVTIVGDDYTVTWDQGYTPTGTLTYCVLYPAYYITPTFTRSRLSTHKRMFHYYGYYDNSIAGKVLKSTDVTVKELVGTRKHDIDFDLAFIFNSETWAATTNLDVYGFESLHWDYGAVDFGSPEQGQKEFSRIVVPIIGAGYGFQVAHMCFSAGTFQLVGYEVRTRSRRSRGYSYVD